MARRPARGRSASRLHGVPWINEEGFLDLTKFPIDQVVRQALDPEDGRFRTGCGMLRSMCAAGRPEAGVFLLGLMAFCRGDLERLALVVDGLSAFHTPQSVEALVNELRRVPSNNSTRRYLTAVLEALSRFPLELVEKELEALAADRYFSPRMRRKFELLFDELVRRGCGGY